MEDGREMDFGLVGNNIGRRGYNGLKVMKNGWRGENGCVRGGSCF